MAKSLLVVSLLACACAFPSVPTPKPAFGSLYPATSSLGSGSSEAATPEAATGKSSIHAKDAPAIEASGLFSRHDDGAGSRHDDEAGAVSISESGPPQQRRSSRGIPNTSGIFSLTLGSRNFEDSRWGALDDQFALGLDYTWKSPASPIGLNVSFSGAGDRQYVFGQDVYAWQGEFAIGPRLYLDIPNSPVYFYGGVAASLVYGEISVPFGRRASETQFGGNISAGVMFKFNRAQAIGLEWRTLQGTDFDGNAPGLPNDSNYQQYSFVFSAAF